MKANRGGSSTAISTCGIAASRLELRDNGVSTEATNLDPPFPAGCGTKPLGTRFPTTYALASANGYLLFPDMVQDMVDAALSTAGN